MKSAIESLFQAAADAGFKHPTLRTQHFKFKRAPDTGVNRGAVYVNQTSNDFYLGKVLHGRLNLREGTSDQVLLSELHAAINEPLESAIKYGRERQASVLSVADALTMLLAWLWVLALSVQRSLVSR